MIRNYIKTAWRNLEKNKFSSFINIGGLGIGMAVAILIGLWIYDELSFNKYHKNYAQIVKVTKRGMTDEGKPDANPNLPMPLADELKTNYSQHFKHILLSSQTKEVILTIGTKMFSKKGQFIEAGAPDMFTLKMLKGTRNGLKSMNSIMLSASTAKALFGNADPMHKVIQVNSDMEVQVTGVFEDLPANTELYDLSFLAPFDLWVSANPWIKEQGWDNHFVSIYAQVKPTEKVDQVSAFIKDAELNKIRNMESRKKEVARNRHVWLLPMNLWHLKPDSGSSEAAQLVWMIGLIGAFVLLLACINFMNLSTARSEKRAKEVGIRKAIGSARQQLIKQFFTESLLVVLLAFILAVGFVALSLPWFNEIAGKQMLLPWANSYFWGLSFCFILLTALIAGSYPAFYLSSFRPNKVLKGTFHTGRFAAIPRKALVVLQFTVSVVLIIGTIIIYRQIEHAKNRPMGYNKEGLLQIEMKTGEFYNKYELLRSELMSSGVVNEMAQSRSPVTNVTMWNGGFSLKGKELEVPRGCGTLSVTEGYGKTVGWEFIAGRDFNRDMATDSAGFIVNESFAKIMGLQNPVGESVNWNPGWTEAKNYTVLGVVKDMVALSPYEPALPTVFFLSSKYNTWINVRLNPNVGAAVALSKIETVFKKLTPSSPFEYEFADQQYALKFAAEERIGKLAGFFAVLAIFISCLGLFGLASFIAEQRTREIGVRKVLGASIFNVWKLLSKDFVFLIIISSFIAIPIAWYFLHQWLQQYEYRIVISWDSFAIAIAGALVITLLTVSFQAIKAALANPVKSLRTE